MHQRITNQLSTGKQLCTVESSRMSGWVIKDALVNHHGDNLLLQPWILGRVFNILFEMRWSAMNCALQLRRSEIFSLQLSLSDYFLCIYNFTTTFSKFTWWNLCVSLLPVVMLKGAIHWKNQQILTVPRRFERLRHLLMKDVKSTGTTDSWQKISVSSGGTRDELLTQRWWIFDTLLLNSWCLFD